MKRIELKMNSCYFFSVFAAIIVVLLSVASVGKANSYNNNNNTNRDYYYQVGPIPDPNDSTHIKAQQQAAQDRWISNVCDTGHGNPSCYNIGYYSGVAEANNDNSYHGIILYSLGCPSPNTANYCAGYIQGYSHTYAGHIPNASEVWNTGYNISYFNGVNVNFNYPNPILNGTNPASCTEGPAAFCEGYSQGYPHGIEFALGRELGVKAANPNTPEIIPPCPPGHTTDWCDGFQGEYNDEWAILSDTG